MARLRFLLPLATALLVSACGGRAGADDPTPTLTPGAGGDAPSAQPTMSAPSFCAGGPADRTVQQRIFDQLTPRASVDYLALRRLEVTLPVGQDSDPGLVTLVERGTLCATAADTAACKKSYGGLSSRNPWSPIVYFTRGSDVGSVTSAASAVALLGGVDSLEEAFFVADLAGYPLSCGASNPATYRATDDGFEIATDVGGCGKPLDHVVVHVPASGEVEEVSRTTKEAITSTCPQP